MGGNDDRQPRPATEQQMEAYDRAITQLATTQVPVLHADPRDRVFYALFDGTSNDADNKPGKMTNVGKLREQFNELERAGDGQIMDGTVKHGYLAGPGTQQGQPLYKLYDNATGASYGDRLETMYGKLAEQTKQWKSEYSFGDGSPETDMRVRVVSVGFSRGAEQAAGFSRLVDEKGIQDKDGTSSSRRAKPRRRWVCSIRSAPANPTTTIDACRTRCCRASRSPPKASFAENSRYRTSFQPVFPATKAFPACASQARMAMSAADPARTACRTAPAT